MEKFIKVKVQAGRARESVFIDRGNQLNISVKEPTEGNAANERVLALVALHFSVTLKSVRIISGHHRPNKLLRVDL